MREDGPNGAQREDLSAAWNRFLGQFISHESELVRELSACWNDLLQIVSSPVPDGLPEALRDFKTPRLEAYHELRQDVAQALLLETASRMQRMRPLQRATLAIEAYERKLDDRLQNLPEAAVFTGPEILDCLENLSRKGPSRYLAGLRTRRRLFQLRPIVAQELRAYHRSRSRLEGSILAAFARAMMHSRSNWETARAILDGRAAGLREAPGDPHQAFGPAGLRLRSLQREIEDLLAARAGLTEKALQRIADRLVSRAALRQRRAAQVPADYAAANLAHWTAQSRTLDLGIRLDVALDGCESHILELCRQSVESLGHELRLLLRELDTVIEWLQEQVANPGSGEFPPPRAGIVPASSRTDELDEGVKSALRSLPVTAESLNRFSLLPRRRPGIKVLRPRQTFQECYFRSGRVAIMRAFEEVADEHRKTVQEIEHAREVVSFARDTTNSSGHDTSLVSEAFQNALSLLTYRRDERRDWIGAADGVISRTIAGVFCEARLLLTQHRLGASAYVAGHGVRRATGALSTRIMSGALSGLRYLKSELDRGTGVLLVRIGWRAAPQAGKVEVVKRSFLPQEFTVDLASKELPALYRHLFRFEPVQDPRFLVGREREMGAIEEVRNLWESRRPVALLIVGERGSGKTSLINCALKRCLTDLKVVRAEFSGRVFTGADMRGFLASALQVDHPDRLEQSFAAQRRVVILEELERCFLRQVGYYGAVRELQRLIAATCTTTLWIVATNEIAFRFLNAAVELGQTFSHRINAGTATRDDLRQAILLRHDLSGLRLQFPPPRPPRRLLDRLRQKLYDHRDPESEFFDFLARESGGVYRSAFDIWLGHIDGAHAGILYMKHLEMPDLSGVIEDLTLEDLFALVAIPQHGALTAEELAMIFQKSLPASRALLDGLLAREIIEPDPGRPGLRVRPEAMRILREALYRKNLI